MNETFKLERWSFPSLVVYGLLLYFSLRVLGIAVHKYYSLDEFFYAHGAWLMANGNVPYRDFFMPLFPLAMSIQSLPFLFVDNVAANVVYIRVWMFPFFLLTGYSIWRINRDYHWLAGVLGVLLTICVVQFSQVITEIRPDPLALCFLLAAIAVFYAARFSTRVQGYLSGILLTCSVLCSQKIFSVGFIFVWAWCFDLVYNRKTKAYFLGHPLVFLAGSLTILLPFFAYLLLTGSLYHWFEWTFVWVYKHQQHYPGFSWTRFFAPLFWENIWLFVMAVVGFAHTCHLYFQGFRGRGRSTEILLIGGGIGAVGAFILQQAAYAYSLIYLLPFIGIFAARGVVLLAFGLKELQAHPLFNQMSQVQVARKILLLLLSGYLAHYTFQTHERLKRVERKTNKYQNYTFHLLEQVVDRNAHIYDNSGYYITHPHAYFFHFTDRFIRSRFPDKLIKEVPKAIEKKGCTVMIEDIRFRELPEPLRRYLLKHFQPYTKRIRLWGQSYQWRQEHSLKHSFHAVRKGSYFISPPSFWQRRELYIQGKKIETPSFELPKGPVEFEVKGQPMDFYILWLPKNKEIYRPGRGKRPFIYFYDLPKTLEELRPPEDEKDKEAPTSRPTTQKVIEQRK